MTLNQLLSLYESSTVVGTRYREGLVRTIRKANATGIVDTCQLTADNVNAMLLGLDLSPTTVANVRRELITLWRFAFERGVTDVYPRGIRKIRPRPTAPQCWTMEELRRLWDAAKKDTTLVSRRWRARRCDLLPAWISIAYDTGLRFADVHSLTFEHIRGSCISTVASKTGKPAIRRLSQLGLDEISRLRDLSPDGTLFQWCLPRRRALLMWRAFLDQHRFDGSSKWLRRSCATQVELREPGAAWRYLQHTSPQLTIRHYLDGTQLSAMEPPPPIISQELGSTLGDR